MKFHLRMLFVLAGLLASIPLFGQGSISDEDEWLSGARGVLVPPVAKNDTTNLVDIGVVETKGFSKLTLNLAGETTDVLRTGGSIGAILIPAIDPFERAFRNRGLLPASLEISVPLPAGGPPEFMAKQVRVDVGFPRYRVLLYNTTSNAANIAFFAYRSNQ